MPTPPDVLIGRIDLNHLTDDQKQKALNIISKYPNVLTSHEYDIPVNTLGVVGDVQLKDNFNEDEIANTKFFPIPAKAKEKVQKIIDNLEKHGIIEKSNTYSPFIQNLLLGKKKSGKPRVLLDSRIMNHWTKKLPTKLTSTQEIFNHFSKAKYVSTIALCFFNLSLDSSDSHQLKVATLMTCLEKD